MRFSAYIIVCFCIFVLTSCGDENYVPKPYTYHRLDLPKHEYEKHDGSCPFVLYYHKNAFLVRASKEEAQKCWLNLVYPKFNATIHLSYKPAEDSVNRFLEESRSLVYKHTVKASGIDESFFDQPDKSVIATIYELGGEAASPLQFNVTDGEKHFFRGALYFNHTTNADSLSPVINFIKEDIKYMVEHFEWK